MNFYIGTGLKILEKKNKETLLNGLPVTIAVNDSPLQLITSTSGGQLRAKGSVPMTTDDRTSYFT